MDSNIELTILDGLNYDIREIDMEILLKSKGLWKYTKVLILDLFDAKKNFFSMERRIRLLGLLQPIYHVRSSFTLAESTTLINYGRN